MFKIKQAQLTRGITLVEVVIVTGLLLLFFGGLFGGIEAMVKLVSNMRAEAGALAVANERIEYIRSLDYYAAGTVGGVVSGTIPQSATSTLNGITYTETISIQYIDRPEDGLATDPDPDLIPVDSKRVYVEVAWEDRGQSRAVEVQTDIIPPGLESLNGGGTILAYVFDAALQPITGAEVTVYNDSFSPALDEVFYTDARGYATIAGVEAAADYQLIATRPGYSVDQTYVASSTNPVPARLPITVASGTVTTLNFQIDQLSDLTIKTIGEPVTTAFVDTFASASAVASTSQVAVGGGEVYLTGAPGSYNATGTLFASTSVATSLTGWQSFDFNASTSAETSVLVRVYSVTGSGTTTSYTLVPDTELAGNSTGFSAGPVNITSIATSSYSHLTLGATLETVNSAQTPYLQDWTLTHIESKPPIGSIGFTLTGAKTIGEDAGAPVYKYQETHTTDGTGVIVLGDMEFDGYSFALTSPGYTISEIIGGDPFEKQAGVDETVELVLSSSVPYSLRTTVNDVLGSPIAGASVRLFDGGYDTTQETSIYGQTYFAGGLSAASYTAEISAPGYETLMVPVTVDGNNATVVELAAAPEGGGEPVTSGPSFLADYSSRVPLTIAGGVLFGDATDFPVYVDMSFLPSLFFAGVDADGDDIRVTEGDGVSEVPFELGFINTGAETGELYFRAPSLETTTTTTFYIYYGNAGASAYAASDTYGRNNVWSNNYEAVYHLNEDPSGSGPQFADSTGNGRNLTSAGSMTASDSVAGRIGGAVDFDGTNDSLRNTGWSWGGGPVTVSFWNHVAAGEVQNSNAFGFRNSGAERFSLDGPWGNGNMYWDYGTCCSAGRVFASYGAYTDAWTHVSLVSTAAANTYQAMYFNANVVSSKNASDVANTTLSNFAIGGEINVAPPVYHDGRIDEFRISSVVRDANWIANQYLNQNTPATFYTIGTIETE